MKKINNFKILWQYLKNEKVKLIIYVILVLSTHLPVLLSTFLWAKALEFIIYGDFNNFLKYLIILEIIYILIFSVVQVIRDKIYYYLEIKFITNVSKDLYEKIDKMPAIAFEEN